MSKKTRPHRQRMPIPQDWDGETWQNICLTWPKSRDFTALLVGIMSQPTRGWWWSERSGVVADAQAIGREIYARNMLFNPCGVGVEPGENGGGDNIVYIFDCGDESEDDCMGSCVLPYGSIKVIDGVLSYKTCDGFVPVDGWEEVVPGQITPDDTDTDPTDPPADDMACQKAYFMAQQFVFFLEALYSGYPSTSIFAWAKSVRAQMSPYEISDWSLLKLHALIAAIWLEGVLFADIWQDVDSERLACLYYPHLNGVDYSLSRDEYNALKSATSNVGNLAFATVMLTAFDALNFSNFQVMAAQAKTVTEYFCECPSVLEGSSIFFTGAYNAGSGDASIEVVEVLDAGRRVRVQYAANADNKKLFAFDAIMAGAQAGDTVKVRLYHNTAQWSPGAIAPTQSDPAPLDQWHNCSFQGSSGGVVRSYGADYVEFLSQNVSGTITTTRIDQAYITPSVVGGQTQRNESVLEVVEVNGVPLTPLGP